MDKPKNLGAPINTPADERGIFVDASGKIAYASLERPKGFGKADIYSFELPPAVRPYQLATYVWSFVRDKESRQPLQARVIIINLAKQDTLRDLGSNKASGEFVTSLPLQERYGLFVEVPGYLSYTAHFDLMRADTAYEIEVWLEKPKKGSRLTLQNVFFDFDKATLKPESRTELMEVVRFLRENPKVRVEVEGHTDSVGRADYNLQLSQRRAEAVRSFLVEQGVDPSRLTARGYGSNRPVADNRTETGRAQNRRVELLFVDAP